MRVQIYIINMNEQALYIIIMNIMFYQKWGFTNVLYIPYFYRHRNKQH